MPIDKESKKGADLKKDLDILLLAIHQSSIKLTIRYTEILLLLSHLERSLISAQSAQ
jgi:hypothetical protein